MRQSSVAQKKHFECVVDELEYIRTLNDGLLDPASVVEYARNEDTLLHSKFEWSDTKAAQEYRLWQARQVIRLELVVVRQQLDGKYEFVAPDSEEQKGDKRVRAFISLVNDRRSEEHRGYRSLTAVLNDEELRDQMLQEAKRDMVVFKKKYLTLNELSKVFAAMDEVL